MARNELLSVRISRALKWVDCLSHLAISLRLINAEPEQAAEK